MGFELKKRRFKWYKNIKISSMLYLSMLAFQRNWPRLILSYETQDTLWSVPLIFFYISSLAKQGQSGVSPTQPSVATRQSHKIHIFSIFEGSLSQPSVAKWENQDKTRFCIQICQ